MAIRKNHNEIDFDEILLDAANLPDFHQGSMEGVIEHPIRKKATIFLGGAFGVLGLIFFARVFFLQVVKGEALRERSENNYLRIVKEEPGRGLIYDRNGKVLAGSEFLDNLSRRVYPPEGFLHVLGYLSYADSPDSPYGASGLEASYDEILRGKPAKKAEEIDAKGNILSAGILEKEEKGRNIISSISYDLQLKLYHEIKRISDERRFKGGAGIFIDIKTGELLSLVSFPDFDPNILQKKAAPEVISGLVNNPRQPFFNRAISGLYPPGSALKPAIAAAVLNENLVNPDKQFLSTGALTLPNIYDPDHPNVFPDWKAHGWVDMRRAIAMSSNVYFYIVGGGYGDQKGLGVSNINKYLKQFGFAEKTGIDIPAEKAGMLPDPNEKSDGRDWSIGDTYNLSIGQGNIGVTPIEMATYVATLANKGSAPYPHLIKAISARDNNGDIEKLTYPFKENILSTEIFNTIHEAMRDAVLFGTAQGLGSLPIKIAAKTGTAEIGDTGKVDSWSIGFFPYEAPTIAYVIMLEAGPRENVIGATAVAAEVIRWISDTGFLSQMNSGILNH